jgi:hypothetical protein
LREEGRTLEKQLQDSKKKVWVGNKWNGENEKVKVRMKSGNVFIEWFLGKRVMVKLRG